MDVYSIGLASSCDSNKTLGLTSAAAEKLRLMIDYSFKPFPLVDSIHSANTQQALTQYETLDGLATQQDAAHL